MSGQPTPARNIRGRSGIQRSDSQNAAGRGLADGAQQQHHQIPTAGLFRIYKLIRIVRREARARMKQLRAEPLRRLLRRLDTAGTARSTVVLAAGRRRHPVAPIALPPAQIAAHQRAQRIRRAAEIRRRTVQTAWHAPTQDLRNDHLPSAERGAACGTNRRQRLSRHRPGSLQCRGSAHRTLWDAKVNLRSHGVWTCPSTSTCTL